MRWSGAAVRSALIIGVVLLTGCPRPTIEHCESTIVAPDGVSAPVGSTTEVTVRFFNPSGKPQSITQLALSSPFSFRDEPRDFAVAAGSCEKPGEVGLVLRFTPTSVGLQQAPLTLLVDGTPTTVELRGTGTGPLLSAASVVNFGYVGLAPAKERALEVRNVGTSGTSLEVSVVSVTATSPNASAEELCVGHLELATCVPLRRLTLSQTASFPLNVVPRSPGGKTWNVEVRAGAQSFMVRVIANAVDTNGCRLTATPATLEFGVALAPEVDTQSTVLRNEGADPCVILEATTSDPQFRVLNWPTTSLLLSVGGSLEVKAEASLTSTRGATGTLTFELATTSRGLPTSFDVPLDARPPASCVVVTPEALDFGIVREGCTVPTRTLSLSNVCARAVLVSQLSVDPPYFASGVRSNIALTQGQAFAFTVGVMPFSTVGRRDGVLRVKLQDGVETLINLSARSEPPTRQTDTFHFDARALTDLVLVLDDSPSFARQHTNVRAELNRMSTWLTLMKANLNTRVAVTSTDVTNNGARGRFRTADAGVRWAAGDEASFSSTFDELTRLTTSGAEQQSCIEAAARALTEPLASDPQANAGFRRLGAELGVVCITDDIEHSTAAGAWRAQLQALDAGHHFTYSVVGPFSSSCAVDAVDDGGTHAANVTPFNGVTTDICGPWELYSIGTFGGGQRTTFFLSSTPVFSSLAVVFDGVALPAQSGAWRYDSTTNAIIVDPSILGLDPRELTITYENACP